MKKSPISWNLPIVGYMYIVAATGLMRFFILIGIARRYLRTSAAKGLNYFRIKFFPELLIPSLTFAVSNDSSFDTSAALYLMSKLKRKSHFAI